METKPKRPKNSWVRRNNIDHKGKPYDKYGFSTHLERVGDWVETEALTQEDYLKIKYAAYDWAYQHRCRVSVNKIPVPGGIGVRIKVVSNHRRY